MMIKRYAELILECIAIRDKYDYSFKISQETDTHPTDKSIIVYFDAAFSREVVSRKTVDGKYIRIESDNGEIVYFIYKDKTTLAQETMYSEFKKTIDNMINDSKLDIVKGEVICKYNSEEQSIIVHPILHIDKTSSEFKNF